MVTPEGAHRDQGRSESAARIRNSFFSTNPPFLDPQREGPSEADISRADTVHSEEIRLLNEILTEQKKHKGVALRASLLGGGIGAGAGAAIAVAAMRALRVFGDEPIPPRTSTNKYRHKFYWPY